MTSAGLISGIPTTTGSFPISVKVTDQFNNTATANLSISVVQGNLIVTTQSLPNGAQGVPYNATLAAAGGTAALHVERRLRNVAGRTEPRHEQRRHLGNADDAGGFAVHRAGDGFAVEQRAGEPADRGQCADHQWLAHGHYAFTLSGIHQRQPGLHGGELQR